MHFDVPYPRQRVFFASVLIKDRYTLQYRLAGWAGGHRYIIVTHVSIHFLLNAKAKGYIAGKDNDVCSASYPSKKNKLVY